MRRHSIDQVFTPGIHSKPEELPVYRYTIYHKFQLRYGRQLRSWMQVGVDIYAPHIDSTDSGLIMGSDLQVVSGLAHLLQHPSFTRTTHSS